LVPKNVRHESRAAFEGWFRTTWLPYLDRVPDDLQTDFIESVIDAYLEKYPAAGDGSVFVKMIRLEIEGRKP
jgi:trans-aconitate 2-methyltransferase